MSSRVKQAKGFTLVELMVVIGIIATLIAVAVPYYVSYKRSSCDEAASGDLAKFAAAYQKWAAELSQMNCDAAAVPATYWTDTPGDWPNTRIAALVGAYYQWNGTNNLCDVRMRFNTDAAALAFEAGAAYGSRPAGWTDTQRWIFRLNATGGVVPLPRDSIADVTGAGWRSFSTPGVVQPNNTTSLLANGCPQ